MWLVLALAPACLGPERAEAQSRRGPGPAGVWVGQDGRDFVGPNSAPVPAPSGVQDLHIRLAGLPPQAIEHLMVRGLGGDEWQYNGPNGPWRAHVERKDKAPTADLYLEPTRVETGRGFTLTFRFEGGRTAEIIVEGGKADPNLRMPDARMAARWVGQDGRDRTGPGPSVGPDGMLDAVVALENLAPQVGIEAVAVVAPDDTRWESGTNPDAHPNAELIRRPDDPSKGEILFQPDRDRAGQTLRIGVRYANGKTDAARLVAGPVDPGRAVPTPELPRFLEHKIAARWLGQGGTEGGEVHVALAGLPTGKVAAAALSDPVGGCWVFRAGGEGERAWSAGEGNSPHLVQIAQTSKNLQPPHLAGLVGGTVPTLAVWQDGSISKRSQRPFDPATYPLPLTFRAGPEPGGAELAFPPIRDETGSTLTLHLAFADGRRALVQVPGGPADPALRGGPEPGGPAARARPGDDLHALVGKGGTVRLAPGTYRLDRPLVLPRPTALIGEPGAVLRFDQPADAPPWTAAVKVHAGRTVLEGFAVRFAGPVRWAADVHYGPAVIGTTDNHDQGHHDLKAGLVFRKLDLESPPPASDWEEAARLIRLATAENGRIEGCRLRGGMVEFLGGPWTIVGNEHLGTHPKTFCDAVFAGHRTHDLVVRENTTRAEGPSGKTWRFLVLTVSGASDLVADNRVADIGPRDTDTVNANAPEIILTEAYRVRFEGRPLALSADGRVLAIPEPQGDPAEPGDVVAILEGPHAGRFVRVAQRIDRTTYLLDEPLPAADVLSIAPGFVGERFEGNRIDGRGGSVAAGMVLAGNLFDTTVARNHVLGCGEALRLVASPTEHPGPWGWSHAPAFGLKVEGNRIEEAKRGVTLAVEHGPPVKSNRGRVYLTATVQGNILSRSPALEIGDPRSRDPGELVLSDSGNRAEGGSAEAVVHSATIGGRAVRDQRTPLATAGAR